MWRFSSFQEQVHLYFIAFPLKCMLMISGCVDIERDVEAQRFNGGQSRGGQT